VGNQLHNRLSDFQAQYILQEYDTVPKAPIHSEIQLRILPRLEEGKMEVRMWWNETFLGIHTVDVADLPLEKIS